MNSTNFEFIRNLWPDLARRAANAESHVFDDPADAVSLLRPICERLISIRFDDKTTREFEPLLQKHGDKLNDERLLKKLHQLRKAANDALHQDTSALVADDAMDHLRTTFGLACLVHKHKSGKATDIVFRKPPRGGEQVARLKRERDEALLAATRGPVNLLEWIDPTNAMSGHAHAQDRFIERPLLAENIRTRLANGQRNILIVGQPGRGKTRLLRELLEQGVFDGFGLTLSYFFTSDSGGDKRYWVRHFYASILKEFALEECDAGVEQADADNLMNRLCRRLQDVCTRNPSVRLVFVIDALDEAGEAGKQVIDFIDRQLGPFRQNVSVVATVRPGYVRHDESQTINLEDQSLQNDHRSAGLSYVRDQLSGVGIPEDQQRLVANVGAGNFEALRLICRHIEGLPSHEERSRYLEDIGSGPDALRQVYDKWWRRLENRTIPEQLDRLIEIASFIAAAKVPVSRKLIGNVLRLGRPDWKLLEEVLTEFLSHSEREIESSADDPTDGEPEKFKVYRFHHVTFSAFVRERFRESFQEAVNRLADFCLKWRGVSDAYSREYCHRFGTAHLIEAAKWSDLESLLTDFEFIEARLVAGQLPELIDNYEQTLRSHPKRLEHNREREKLDQQTRQWIDGLFQYSNSWRKVREKVQSGQEFDLDAERQRIRLPEPPDSRLVERAMLKAEASSRTARLVSNNGVDQVLDFWRFVTNCFGLLTDAPTRAAAIARDNATGTVSAAATEFLQRQRDERPTLARTQGTNRPPFGTMILRRIYDIVDCDIVSGKMSTDGSVGSIWSEAAQRDLVWDLRAGSPLLAGIEFDYVHDLSVDGRMAVIGNSENVDDDDSTLTLIDVRAESILATLSGVVPAPHCSAQMTPDGSVFACLQQEDEHRWSLSVWDTVQDILRQFHVDDLEVDFSNNAWAMIGPSGCVVGVLGLASDGEFHWRCWDLTAPRGSEYLGSYPADEMRNSLDDWFQKELRLAIRLSDQNCTIDGRLGIRKNDLCASLDISSHETGNAVRSFSTDRRSLSISAISADGRFGFAALDRISVLLDLADGVMPTFPDPENEASAQAEEAAAIDQATEVVSDEGSLVQSQMIQIVSHKLPSAGAVDDFDDDTDWLSEFAAAREHNSHAANHTIRLVRSLDGQCLREWTGVQFPAMPTMDGTTWVMCDRELYQLTGRTHFFSAGSEPCAIADLLSGEVWRIRQRWAFAILTRDSRLAVLCDTDQAAFRFLDIRNDCQVLQTLIKPSFGLDSWQGFRHSAREPWQPATDVVCTPDGRILLHHGKTGLCLTQISGAQSDKVDSVRLIQSGRYGLDGPPCFSPCGQYLLTPHYDEYVGGLMTLYLWNVGSGECIGAASGIRVEAPYVDCDGLVRDRATTESLNLRIETSEPLIPWVTAARVYRFAIPSVAGCNFDKPLFPKGRIRGQFDEALTFCCPRCRKRVSLPKEMLGRIASIQQEHNLPDDGFPVLHLPNAAWNDAGVFFDCSGCSQRLRSTPFVVDRVT